MKLRNEANFSKNDFELNQTQQNAASVIVFEELTNYLLSPKEGRTKEALKKCLVALQELQLEVPEQKKKPIEKQLLSDFKEEQNELTVDNMQQLFELVSDVGLSNVIQSALQVVSNDDFNKIRYSVTVSGGDFEHSEELATIHIKDYWGNTEMNLAVWPDDDTLNPEYIEKGNLGATYIMVYDTDSGELEPETIRDFFGEATGRDIEKSIVEAHLNGDDMHVQVKNVDFLQNYLPQRYVLNWVGEMANKAENETLTKKDVLYLARTLQRTEVEVEGMEFLKNPFEKVLKKGILRPKEITALKEVFGALNIESSVFKSYSKNNELVRG